MNVAKLKSQSTPYTYILEWTAQNKRYIGARWAAGCHPSDLWTEYFTSSKYVEKFVALYGPPDVILIDQTFDSALDAMTREQELQYKFNVRYNDDFLNKAVAGVWDHNDPDIKAKMSSSQLGKKHTQEHKDKIGIASKNTVRTAEWCERISAAHKGKKLSPEHVEKMASSKRGVKQSDETIKKRSLKLIGNKSRTGQTNSEETRRKMSEYHLKHKTNQHVVSCPNCEKSGQYAVMCRWHFDNCKQITKE